MILGAADVLVRAKTDQYNRDLKGAENRTKLFGKKVSSTIKSVSSSFVSLAGPAGVAAFTISMTRTGARFESQMATVRGVMRASDSDFKALTNAAKLMGETTEWSASESASALEFMGMAGYSASQAIESLPGVLDLATAGGLQLGRASDIVTDSLTAMGMGVDDLSRFNDVLIGTITRSNTNIEMMGESLKYSAPIASQYGYEIEQLAAMIGTLANAGIKASDAGTDLRQAMVRNKKAAKELGTAETDLIGTLKAAKEAGWGVNEVTENYGMIASKSVLVLMNQLETYEKLEKQLHNVSGETEKLAGIKLDTLTGDFDLLKSTMESVKNEAYETLNGVLREGVRRLTEDIRNGKDNVINLAENIGGLLEKLYQAKDLFESFPDYIKGPAGYGIAAAIIAGGPAGMGVAAIAAINEGMKSLNMLLPSKNTNLGQLPKYLSDYNKSVQNIKDVFTGKKDWWTGEEKGPVTLISDLISMWQVFKEDGKDAVEAVVGYSSALKEGVLSNIDFKELFKNDEVINIKTENSGFDEQDIIDKKVNAYRSAYSQIGIANKEIFNAMLETYETDKQAFIDATCDKETAELLYNKKVASLLSKMDSDRKKDVEESTRRAAEKKQAYIDLYKNYGVFTTQAYQSIISEYVKDREKFIGLTNDKAAAYEAYYERIKALNLSFSDSSVDLIKIPVSEKFDSVNIKFEKTKTLTEQIKQGSRSAFATIESRSLTTANIVENTLIGAFDGVGDAFADWVSGTKSFSDAFTDMANSIIGDLARMMIKQQLFNAISGLGSAGGWTKEYTSGDVTTYSSPVTHRPLKESAKGNVFSGPGISSYSNQIVSTPTFFPFAEGVGLMGEDGPEAIMPLTRTKSGNLGVRSEGASSTPAINVEINLYNESGEKLEVSDNEMSMPDMNSLVCNIVVSGIEQNQSGLRDVIRGTF